ncbi:trub family pseudouridylate synthase [Coniochaeta sp. 2T2.1]|nr:trub family pseudouridylate synthase [Coniochaeta sp. 2T2.1]
MRTVSNFFNMAKGKVLEGVFAINKPYGMSSAQVIRDCQEYFNPSNLFAPLLEQEAEVRARESKGQQKRRSRMKRDLRVKMGHGGTLDPLATGVLILGVGKGTKSLSNFITCTKTYETVVLFGASTDTYDRVGRIVKKSRYDEITRPMVEKALESFRGKYKQMPPLFAALKMDGKPIYEYAREGKPLPREIETRDVDVSELEMLEWYEPDTHNHHWPTEEAQESEKYLVNSVWKLGKQQTESGETPKKLTPEQEEQETQALAEFEITKQKADERVDGLIKDKKSKRPSPSKPALMSGALGDLPPPIPKGRGSNLIPPPPAPGTPPPWEGKGPPAAKLRMTVTSGFYVRSLCHDLGEKLGCGGMMAELVRTRQGEFSLGTEECLEYEELAKGENAWGPKVETMLLHWMNKPVPGVDAPRPAEPALRKRSHDETEKAEREQASAKRARKNSSSPDIKPSIERVKKESQSPKKSPAKKEEVAAAVLPSIETPSQEDGVDVSKVLDAVNAAANAKVETEDKAIPSVEEEEWNGIEDDPAPAKA